MRCDFLRGNKIQAVYFLESGTDEELIRQSEALFNAHAEPEIEGFEIWEGRRFVYRSGRKPKRGQRSTEV